jgi:hypothetical protein
MEPQTLAVHPLADVFPMVEGRELDELAESIRIHGLREQLRAWRDHDGRAWLVDGRNRRAACELAGRELTEADVEWLDLDAEAVGDYVIARNVHRRGLTLRERIEHTAEVLRLSATCADNSGPGRPKSLRTLVAERGGFAERTVRQYLDEQGEPIERERKPATESPAVKAAYARGYEQANTDREASALAQRERDAATTYNPAQSVEPILRSAHAALDELITAVLDRADGVTGELRRDRRPQSRAARDRGVDVMTEWNTGTHSHRVPLDDGRTLTVHVVTNPIDPETGEPRADVWVGVTLTSADRDGMARVVVFVPPDSDELEIRDSGEPEPEPWRLP